MQLRNQSPDGQIFDYWPKGRRRSLERGIEPEAKDERRLMRFQKMLSSFELLIIDELGFVPLSKTGAELLLEVFGRRYERSATLVMRFDAPVLSRVRLKRAGTRAIAVEPSCESSCCGDRYRPKLWVCLRDPAHRIQLGPLKLPALARRAVRHASIGLGLRPRFQAPSVRQRSEEMR
jgi:hypothetical protein